MTGRRGRRHKQLLNNFNPLNAALNPICNFLVLLGAHHILHVSRICVNVRRVYWKLKAEVIERTLWRISLGRGNGPVVRHIKPSPANV